MERLLPLNVIRNINALLYKLPVILGQKYNHLSFWCCRLRMLVVRKALSSAQVTNMQRSIKVVFLEIGEHIAYCMIVVVAYATSKILHAFFKMNLDNG